jgi:signal transduction histidine kinase
MPTQIPTSPWKTLALSFVIAVLFWIAEPGPYVLWLSVMSWTAICVASEGFWHRAPDETSVVSMAPAAEIGALLALPPACALPVVVGSRLLGSWVWRREGLSRALQESGAALLSTSGALAVLLLMGRWLPPTHLASAPRGFLTVAAVGLVFIGFEQGCLSYWTARRRETTWGRAWRDSFGKATGLMTTGALLTVAGLVVFGGQTLGVRGILLAAMPALFVRDGSRRNIDLELAQAQLIKNERLAAKGEMAAEIGHELNNYLAAISGRAQLLLRKIEAESQGPASQEAERVRQLANQMAELARGLMEFSHRDVKRTAVGINELVEKTVDFVKPQMKFRNIEFKLDPDPALPRVEIDPGQIQQVLLVLLGKAAENPAPGSHGILQVRTFNTPDRAVGIEIGIEATVTRIRTPEAEPEDEAAIDTVRRILDRHHGRLEDPEDGGDAGYRVILPAA